MQYAFDETQKNIRHKKWGFRPTPCANGNLAASEHLQMTISTFFLQ
jgi:hypothetical protein